MQIEVSEGKQVEQGGLQIRQTPWLKVFGGEHFVQLSLLTEHYRQFILQI